jgi:plasmid stabilization system protein ParE
VIRAIDFHPEALQEAEAGRDWYAERSPVASRAFVIELTHAVEQIAESPEMWPQYDLDTRGMCFRGSLSA